MDHQATIRLGDLAEITGRTRASLRNDIARRAVPWDDDEFEPGLQRRFDGFHVLALTIAEMILTGRTPAKKVSQAVREASVQIEHFFDRLAKHERADDMNVIYIQEGIFDELGGYGFESRGMIRSEGSKAEVVDEISRHLSRFNSEWTSREGTVLQRQKQASGVFHCSVVNIRSAYAIAKQRAECFGFMLDGRRIIKVEDA